MYIDYIFTVSFVFRSMGTVLYFGICLSSAKESLRLCISGKIL